MAGILYPEGKMAVGGKTFVLDTNVILHDSSCIEHFDEHDIVIPITVIEELDQFKKGGEIINFHARQFLRTLDNLSSNRIFNGGIPTNLSVSPNIQSGR